jgi:beta-glucosidase
MLAFLHLRGMIVAVQLQPYHHSSVIASRIDEGAIPEEFMKANKVCRRAVSISAVIMILSVAVFAQEAKPLYMDPSKPLDNRVNDLVGRMTLEEKASLLVNHNRAIPRLGVPEYNLWSEALHGVANNGIATVFPQAIGLGATFDPPLVKQMAEAIGKEARVKYNQTLKAGSSGRLFQGLTFFSPNINIFRDPRWGRGQETYGEDPLLTGRMGVSFIQGLQGNDPDHLTAVATAKHYAVHSGPEPLRHGFNAKVSLHDMEDTYLPAFRDAVINGKVNVVMCVYNAVNGIPGCANNFLLNETLRQEWSFNGFVTGDCNAVDDIYSGHKYVKTAPEAAAAAIKAGMDNDCTVSFEQKDGPAEFQKYLDAVNKKLLTEPEINTAVKRMMRTRFALGLFDPPETVKQAQVPDSMLDSPEHRQLALKLARESMVLLKNDGILPLEKKPAKIAVVGPLADSTRVLLGNYNGTPSRSITALEGIQKKFPDAKVVFEPGALFLRPNVLIPSSALSTDNGETGLKAEVFATNDLSGTPVETRIDPQIAIGAEQPGAMLGSSADQARPTRWTGWLTPSISGQHIMGIEGFGNKLFIDDKLLIDTSKGFAGGPNTIEISLEKGRKYLLKAELTPGSFSSARLVWRPAMPDTVKLAVEAAQQSDIVIAVVGITSDLEGEESGVDIPGFKGGDRTSLDLPQQEQELLDAMLLTGKPLIVVLMSGSAIAVNWAERNANAILQAWYPGEEGGTAIAETLSGENNPAGRLPVTFYRNIGQLPEFTDYSMAQRTYRYYVGDPLYPFGYGMSYSTFSYSDLKISTSKLNAGDPLQVDVTVANSGSREGDEVVQLYLTFPKLAGAPRRALRGFQRIHLRAGENRTMQFTIADRDISYVKDDGIRDIGPGKYSLSVGGGQPGPRTSSISIDFEIKGYSRLSR